MNLCAAPLLTNENQVADKKPMSIPQPIQDEHEREVQRLAYSPKLKLLASAPARYFYRGQIPALPIYLWDVQTGKCLEGGSIRLRIERIGIDVRNRGKITSED
jgi:WD40 repeat protein